jgi:hypothetical protein
VSGVGGWPGRLVGACLRLDRRRDLPWLAVAAAVIAAASVAGRSVPLAAAAAAVVTVAAVGDPPRGLAGPVGAWVVARTLGPAVAGGATLAALAPAGSVAALTVGWLAGVLAAASMFFITLVGGVATSRGVALPANVAGSVAMLSVFGAAGAGAVADGPWAAAAASGLWLTVAVMWSVALPRLPAPGPTVAEGLTAAAMLSTLCGMVGWLFLVPEQAGSFTWLVTAWFLALAVPRTALAAGVQDERRRQRLVPAAVTISGKTAALHAMILGWPLMVAAGLANDGSVVEQRLLVVGGLVVAAAVAAVVARLTLGSGRDRETAQVLVVAALFLAAGLFRRVWP